MDGLSLDGFVAGVSKHPFGLFLLFVLPGLREWFFLSYGNDVGNSGAKIRKIFENCSKMRNFKLQTVVKCVFYACKVW